MSKNYAVRTGGVDLLVYAMDENVVIEDADGRCVAKFTTGHSWLVRNDLDRALDLATRDAAANAEHRADKLDFLEAHEKEIWG